jgi:hypothetical protein
MSSNTKPLLYNSIVVEMQRENAFAVWREKVTLFKAMFNGAGMSLINRKFRPWKAPGLKRQERYKAFLKFYKFYYVSKKVMRDVLNELIFHRSLRGERLTTAFADSLIQFDGLAEKCMYPPQSDSSKSNPSSPEKESVQQSPVDDEPKENPVAEVNVERSSSDESLGTPGHESNWNYSDDVSYDSDDVYDTNMFPGYGRSPQVDSGPTFTYLKKT